MHIGSKKAGSWANKTSSKLKNNIFKKIGEFDHKINAVICHRVSFYMLVRITFNYLNCNNFILSDPNSPLNVDQKRIV